MTDRSPHAPRTPLPRLSALLLATALVGSCSSGPADLGPPRLVDLTISTIGLDPDPDGYLLVRDDRGSRPVGATDTLSVESTAGILRLEGVASNCSASEIGSRDPAEGAVRFRVECLPLPPQQLLVNRVDLFAPGGQTSTIVSIDLEGVRRLTSEDESAGRMEFSPDGELIVYDVARGAFRSDIRIMQRDGSGARQLTAEPRGGVSPSWAPDGGRIVFADGDQSVAEFEEFGLHYIDPDGTGRTPFFSETGSGANSGGATAPRWSPTGEWIAFEGRRSFHQRLFLIDPLGLDTMPLFEDPMNMDTDVDAAWSPDGTRLAFASRRPFLSPELFDIYVLTVNSMQIERITDGPWEDRYPTWSPNGDRILFASDRAGRGNLDLWVVDLETGALQQVTDGREDDLWSDWR